MGILHRNSSGDRPWLDDFEPARKKGPFGGTDRPKSREETPKEGSKTSDAIASLARRS
jgi:hypothetical protein